ncbi:MAG: UDP-glucose--hexose-1-phosphate uridylyltransferase [Cetobacterium sp.]|uniref:UDP-glucose--hexose-1-phosphate uridylyltransferase n=1 Tax=Cetobacterium sp. TaxID=2071632 RepID=UPI002FCA83A0
MGNIYSSIEKLLNKSLENSLIGKYDKIVARNGILNALGLDDWKENSYKDDSSDIEDILDEICDWAIQNKVIEDSLAERELLDTKLMGIVTPSQSVVISKFERDYEKSPELATKNFYEFSKNTNYIRKKRIDKNQHWLSKTEYGDLEITINLAKPEKDPKDIIRERNMPKTSYPSCLLCIENVGYAGRLNHPARQNHRVIPLILGNQEWYFQYSPYVYYNQHSIIFSVEHRPMKINKDTFKRVLEFVEKYPHYFIGSNADLPIVGGSILSHDHYQAGSHEFPMAKAPIEKGFKSDKYPDVEIGIVKWPMSVIRLTSDNIDSLVESSDEILTAWRDYSDESVGIYAYTNEVPHNTITPIARRKKESFEIDLVLRNNRTDEKHPLGIFHPHSEVHNIKKENIGLIEVMGLAVLPGRLESEIKEIVKALESNDWKGQILGNRELEKHLEWIIKILPKNKEISNKENFLREEIGKTFSSVLEHAGVYKRDLEGELAFERFMYSVLLKKYK